MQSDESDKAPEDTQGRDTATPTEATVSRRLTLASLQLNVEAAEKGKVWFLIPRTEDGYKYPLPSSDEDLLRLSLIPLKNRARSDGSVYIRRARKEIKRRRLTRTAGSTRIDDQAHAARQATYRFREAIKTESASIAEEMERFRLQVAKSTAALTSLYDLVKKGQEMILRGFVDNVAVNGEPVTIAAFQRSSSSVFGHVARIGLPSDDDKPTEEAVFKEFAAAVEKTRGGIEATISGATTH